MNKKIPVLLVVWMAAAPLMAADSAFYFVALKDLKFEAGAPPTLPTQSHPPRRSSLRPVEAQPYAHLDGPGEIFLSYGDRAARRFPWNSTVRHVAVKAPSGGEVRGRLFWPKPDSKGTRIFPFRIPAAKASKSARDGFYQAMSEHYSALQRGSQPGSAWFRHRHMEANRERRGRERQDSQDSSDNRETREIDDTFDLFTGGRAISENLQLDRQLESAEEGKLSVRVGSLSGITVNAMDFRPLIKGRKPELDSLARFIPEDQHAVFFPSFASLTRMMDETRDRGVNLLFSFEPESQNDQIRQRYQTQLFLPLNKIARLLGPQIIGSVALTGSDPYVRTGSDLVVLFESSNPEVLLQTVRASQALAVQVDAAVRTVVETVHGVEALGVVSTDRRISSYVARWEDLVLVANSRTQLARVINVARGRAKSLGELDEYRFFRLKYPKTPTETAFVVVPDAAIRRWCGPRWRIGASRRTRAAAILSDLQARHMTALVRGTPASRQLDVDHGLPNKGEFHLLGDGVFSTAYGSTAFLTPIAELEIDKVSRAEANAYNRFRDQYQGRWRRFFDPIGIRLSTQGEELRGEVAVYPMIGGSEYRNLAMLATGSELTPSSGDPHPETLIHWALALNTKSDLFQRFSTFFAFATRVFEPIRWGGSATPSPSTLIRGPFGKNLNTSMRSSPSSQNIPRTCRRRSISK